MNGLMLHCGGKAVSKDELSLIPLPAETDTYKPVAHDALANRVLTVSQDLLTLKSGGGNFKLVSESYGIAREGNQLFAVLVFKNENTGIGLAIGYRNSLDKSLTLGIVCGGNVFVCDNLCISGEIQVMRKHTKNVWSDIEEKLITTCYKSRQNYHQICDDSDKMIRIPFDNRKAGQTLGELYMADIISPRQLVTVKSEWLKPSHEEFAPRNAWSYYNAVTEALKSDPPSTVMESHKKLHDYFNANVIDLKQTDSGLFVPPSDIEAGGEFPIDTPPDNPEADPAN